MKRLILIALLGLLALPAFSSAQTSSPAAVAERWGLMGRWRQDCAQPIAKDNLELQWQTSGGFAYHYNNGERTENNPIRSATVQPDGSISLVMTFPGLKTVRENVWAKTREGALTVRQSRDLGSNEYFIKDGVIVRSGQPYTTTFVRCGAN